MRAARGPSVEELVEQHERARRDGNLVHLVQVPLGRRYLDRLGQVLTRTFKVRGEVAERLVLPELPCRHHLEVLIFPWEACPECAPSGPGEVWDST